MKEIAEYVGRKYDHGGDIRATLENKKRYEPAKPKDPPDGASVTEKRIWEKEVDEYVKQKTKLTENMKKAFSLIHGQCTEYLRAKLEALPNWTVIKQDYDVLALIKAIQGLTYSFDGESYEYHAMYHAHRQLYVGRQAPDATNAKYLEQFQNTVKVIEQHGGRIGYDIGTIKSEINKTAVDPNAPTEEERKAAVKAARDRYLAMAFLSGADRARYSGLLKELHNDFTKGANNFPGDVIAAYKLLTNYRGVFRPLVRPHESDGLSFATVAGGGGRSGPGNNATSFVSSAINLDTSLTSVPTNRTKRPLSLTPTGEEGTQAPTCSLYQAPTTRR